MSNDFETLREIFEMAEVLDIDGNGFLEIVTVDERTDRTAVIKFLFNENDELTEVIVQE